MCRNRMIHERFQGLMRTVTGVTFAKCNACKRCDVPDVLGIA